VELHDLLCTIPQYWSLSDSSNFHHGSTKRLERYKVLLPDSPRQEEGRIPSLGPSLT
jgi:hypothetical protein